MTRRHPVLILAALLAAALAGCVQDEAPTTVNLDPDPVTNASREEDAPREEDADGEDAEPEEDEDEAPAGDEDESAAGDAGDAQDEDETPPEETPPAPRVETTRVNGFLTGAEAATPGDCCAVYGEDSRNVTGEFIVEPGIAGVVVELTWEHETFDLDLTLTAPGYAASVPPEANGTEPRFSQGRSWEDRSGGPGEPGSRAVIRVTDADALAEAGTWTWAVTAEVAHEVAFTVHVSLFHGTPPEEGFTAATGRA